MMYHGLGLGVRTMRGHVTATNVSGVVITVPFFMEQGSTSEVVDRSEAKKLFMRRYDIVCVTPGT